MFGKFIGQRNESNYKPIFAILVKPQYQKLLSDLSAIVEDKFGNEVVSYYLIVIVGCRGVTP